MLHRGERPAKELKLGKLSIAASEVYLGSKSRVLLESNDAVKPAGKRESSKEEIALAKSIEKMKKELMKRTK